MPKSKKYLSENAVTQLSEHIQAAGGNEVFFVGAVNEDKIVTEVQVYARGNEFEAPALLQVAKQGEVVLHNHPSGTLRPSSADTGVASILGNDGIGFYIINNDASEVYVVVEPFAEKKTVPVSPESLGELLSQGSKIANNLEEYEYRPQQIEMMALVGESINENKLAIIEAGTGTGKTLAYLLPAILYAVANKERIVVSTNTINLQEQLINKDIPFLQKVLKDKFNAVLVKGRSNYACKRKLAEVDLEPDLFSDETGKQELVAVLEWAKKTSDGSKSELSFIPKPDVWEKVQSESDTSLKVKCPFYNECFFYAARRKAAVADILVANHHLLFADLAIRALIGASENAILPTYDRIILDEAHNIEDVATNYFGNRVTSLGVKRVINRLYLEKKGKEKGLLLYLSNKLNKSAKIIPYNDFIALQGKIEQDGIKAIKALNFILSAAMDQIFDAVANISRGDPTAGEVKLRLTGNVTSTPFWRESILAIVKKLVNEIRKVTTRLDGVLSKVEELQRKMPATLSLSIDVKAQLDRLDSIATNIEQTLLESDDLHVRWIEIKKGYGDINIVRLQSCPLNVAPILKKTVYEKFKNVVLTSATLAVQGNFNYLKTRLGLETYQADKLISAQLSAPFDYKKQTLVAIPVDVPEPNSPLFLDAIQEMIFESIQISEGRAFVLFTSYGLLNKVFFSLRKKINELGINVYKQGGENRHSLLQRFKEDVSSVLFATESFWEGVDVHGRSLESVIITKLPFKVPSEPIIEARIEALERDGRNAFLEYAVPQAAIKFKQGFGRLIRRKSDRGTVLILDKRVVQKNYGRVFLDSLPDCTRATGTRAEILQALREFY